MMSERKKYNYNVGSSLHGYTRASKAPMTPRNQNYSNYTPVEPASYRKRIGELETANKVLVEETAKQFQKFEADILRVQGILEQKEKRVQELEKDSVQAKEDQGTLIQALKQKEEIIQELQLKLKEILEKSQTTQASQIINSLQKDPEIEIVFQESSTQTDKLPEPQIPEYKQKYENSARRNIQLEEQLCSLKEEVFSTKNQLALVQQEFSTYKVLHEIELLRNQNGTCLE